MNRAERPALKDPQQPSNSKEPLFGRNVMGIWDLDSSEKKVSAKASPTNYRASSQVSLPTASDSDMMSIRRNWIAHAKLQKKKKKKHV